MATYTIKQGDNLFQIAKKYGVSTSSILNANPGVYGMGPGVTLRIPTTAPPAVELQRGGGGGGGGTRGPSVPGPPAGTQPGYVPPPSYYQPPISPKRKPPPKRPPGWTPPRIGPPTGPPPLGTRPAVPQPVQPTYTGPYAPPPRPPTRSYTQNLPPTGVPPAGMAQPQPQPTYTGPYGTQRPTSPLAIQPGGIQERFVGILDRLFNREPRYVDPATAGMGTYDPSRFYLNRFLGSSLFDPQGYKDLWKGYQLRAAEAQKQGRPSTYTGGAVGAAARERAGIQGTGRELFTAGQLADQTQAGEQVARGGTMSYRMINADGSVGRQYWYSMSEDDVGPDGVLTDEAVEKYEKQRADHVEMSILRNDWPMIILKSDQLNNGYSDEWMEEQGYFWNEDKQYWEYGLETEGPQVAGAALPGYGYSYNYPSYGGGGGYAAYTYPESFVGREGAQYPQSFAGGEQAGRVPQRVRTQAARFGMVTWRI